MQEKSKGILLFAFNTDVVDYVKIADRCARLVHHTLGLPVTLVTDNNVVTEHIDQTILAENTLNNRRAGYAGGTQWRNGNRYQAHELSPYDETILLDTDYLILDKSLLTMLESTIDYRLIHHNQNFKQSMSGNMGPVSLDFVWATAVCFKKTEKSKLLFELVGRIQRNYRYYQQLYQLRERNFRNDYAFAIANNILNGYVSDSSQSVPWNMLTIDQPVKRIELQNNKLVIREQEKAYIVPKQNIHIMDKDYLQSEQYIQLVDMLCQE